MTRPWNSESPVRARQSVIRKLNKLYFELQEAAERCGKVGRADFSKRLNQIAPEIGAMAEVLETSDRGKRLSESESAHT